MPRATPLPLDERRAALIEATLPLLVEHGRSVSTRQIAEAAEVAEGTIFRAFDSKDALIDAALRSAFDSTTVREAVARIDPALGLEQRLRRAATLVQAQLRTVFGLFHALRLDRDRPDADQHERHRRETDDLNATLADLIAPDAGRLSVSPQEAARLLRTLLFALTHPYISEQQRNDPDFVVDVLLHGVLRPVPATPDDPDPQPSAEQSPQLRLFERTTTCSSVS